MLMVVGRRPLWKFRSASAIAATRARPAGFSIDIIVAARLSSRIHRGQWSRSTAVGHEAARLKDRLAEQAATSPASRSRARASDWRQFRWSAPRRAPAGRRRARLRPNLSRAALRDSSPSGLLFRDEARLDRRIGWSAAACSSASWWFIFEILSRSPGWRRSLPANPARQRAANGRRRARKLPDTGFALVFIGGKLSRRQVRASVVRL